MRQPPSRFKFSDVVSVVSLVIALGSLATTVYLNFFWRPEDLRVYFFLRDMKQVGNTPLSIDFVFSNGGKQAAIVSDVMLIQATGLKDGFDVCSPARLRDYVEIQLIHKQGLKELDFPDGTKLEFVQPSKALIDSKDTESPSLVVQNGETKPAQLLFQPREIDAIEYPVVHCLGFRYFDKNGNPHVQILPAWRVSTHGGGRQFTPAADEAHRLLPTQS